MKLLFTIAWRNIFRHKAKSIVIGTILFIGSLLMTVGNGVISGMDKGLQKNIVKSFTGDIVLVSKKQESDNIFFSQMGRSIEPLYNYAAIKKVLDSLRFIEKTFPFGINFSMVLHGDGGNFGYSFLMGVDLQQYQKVFPANFSTIEGRVLHKDEPGILLSANTREELFNQMNFWYIPKHDTLHTRHLSKEARDNGDDLNIQKDIVFMGATNDNTATDIRATIAGIIKYQKFDTLWGMFSLLDIESFRRCFGYISSSETPKNLTQNQLDLLSFDESNLDATFTNDNFILKQTTSQTSRKPLDTVKQQAPFNQHDTITYTNKTDSDDNGAYNVVSVFLKDGIPLEKAESEINALLSTNNLPLRAISWKKATGSLGSMAAVIKSSLFVFVMLLFFVAIIIIVNTLTMTALERTSEIGMIRAIGAKKSFISALFFWETGILSFFFGGLALITGVATIKILASLNLKSQNNMVQLLCGGDTFSPLLSVTDIGLVILQLTLVTLIAVIYPILVARRITPLDAIMRD